MKKYAFTLAEALITLGIIGVVAALTMPALIANHKKKVLITRIKKFYSSYNQAYNMKIADDGEIDASMLNVNDSPDAAMKFFNANYAPYMKVLKTEKTAKGMAAALPDGAGLYIRKSDHADSTTSSTYIVFCVEYKKCKNINETPIRNYADSKDTFIFWTNAAFPIASNSSWDGTREGLISRCKTGLHESCTALVMYDGWEIKDDYPIKF
jgi:type II secretory pathway pseudopilin PulG